MEAIDLMIQGAENLVVPIRSSISRRKQLQRSSTAVHNGQEFCWLTQEDVLRFLLSSIGLFSPIAPLPIETLSIITTEFLSVEYNLPASSAIAAISRSLADQTSVAVVDDEGSLIGEISPLTLAGCDETAAAAILTLSAGDLMAYIDCGGPTEEMVRVVEDKLKEKKLKGMLKEIMATTTTSHHAADASNSSSSDEELSSPTTTLSGPMHHRRTSSNSGRMARRAGAEAVVCHRGSSLVAVMIQAITRRVNYVWVMEDDCSVVGIVTFANMLEVFQEHLESLV